MKSRLLKIYYATINLKEYFTVSRNKIFNRYYKIPVILDTDQTIEKLISSDCSMSRFGDGEFSIVEGRGIAFQSFDPKMQAKMKEILKSESENHITCIPFTLVDTEGLKEKAAKYWEDYFLKKKHSICRNLNLEKIYYDSLVTRLYIDYKNIEKVEERFTNLKKVWEGRKLLILEGEKSRLGVGNDLFSNAKQILRIICPATNAYSSYETIISEVKKSATKDTLILLALGPTATVLAYDLCAMGYRALDIGHVDVEYEWFLMGAEGKVPLKNKFVGDIFTSGENIALDEAYQKSIVAVI